MTLEFLERSGGLGVPVPRRASLDTLLRYAWDAEVFTAGDALSATGLSRSTTIEAIDDLVELGLVRELANARAGGDYRKGRPSRRFELRSDAKGSVPVDPQEPAQLIPDSHEQPLVGTGLNQQLVNHRHDRRQRMAATVLLKGFSIEEYRGRRHVRVGLQPERTLPGFFNDSAKRTRPGPDAELHRCCDTPGSRLRRLGRRVWG